MARSIASTTTAARVRVASLWRLCRTGPGLVAPTSGRGRDWRLVRREHARHLWIALGVEHAEQQAHERNQQKIRHEARDQDAEAIEPAGHGQLPAALEIAVADSRNILGGIGRQEPHI